MEEPRAARTDEFEQVLDLINSVFRTSKGLAPTMGQEFPQLLCRDNVDNMRIITDNGRPVSDVNYYRTKIIIQGSSISAASVGAVCTHPGYRGQNLASNILDDVEAKLRRENVDIMLVSGARNLYLNRGCCVVGGFLKAVLKQGMDMDSQVEVEDMAGDCINRMAAIYNMEPVRYYRSLYEFSMLLKGATTPWDNYTYRVFLIKDNNEAVGYIVVRITHGEGDTGMVIEYAGDRKAIYESLYMVIKKCSLENLTLYIPHYDPIKLYFNKNGVEMMHQNLHGTVKIINFQTFMNNLKPYFMQCLPYKSAENIKFIENKGEYIFKINGEELCISDLNTLSQLVFGSRDGQILDSDGNSLIDKPYVRQFFSSALPIPFPWVRNLNYA